MTSGHRVRCPPPPPHTHTHTAPKATQAPANPCLQVSDREYLAMHPHLLEHLPAAEAAVAAGEQLWQRDRWAALGQLVALPGRATRRAARHRAWCAPNERPGAPPA